jgi:hypothetical protein
MKNADSKALHESAILFFKQKFSKKNMVDQGAFDLLASVEQHRLSSAEVDMFYKFFTLEYPLKELLFFLYVRSLAERELAIMITKIPSSQDVRHV